MRGYFAIGCYGISKAGNVGALLRTAHAFGAGFAFTVNSANSEIAFRESDTSNAARHMPLFHYQSIEELVLPQRCKLVAIELTPDAAMLPSFHHPPCAAYILGPERGEVPPEILTHCDHIIKIPTQFSLNLSVAGALVLYDRWLSKGRFAPRPVRPGSNPQPSVLHRHGAPLLRQQKGV